METADITAQSHPDVWAALQLPKSNGTDCVRSGGECRLGHNCAYSKTCEYVSPYQG